jgi:3-deoxy-manno-octulosonate cytidylyltransferase (CMP-KDO synthetase)
MKTICVIPSRYGSTRLAAKPLALLHGRPMVAWVVDVARGVPEFDEVIVATDHEEIAAAARAAGVEAVLTDPDLPSGTDRVHAAIAGRKADVVVNLQGDEPVMPAEALSRAHRALLADARFDIATACVPIFDRATFDNPMVVKVVRDTANRALFFSRSPIPSASRRPDTDGLGTTTPWGFKHLGIYLYKREALERFVALPPSPLERVECLEQLRALEAGMTFVCVDSPADSVSVDVAEDLERAAAQLRPKG